MLTAVEAGEVVCGTVLVAGGRLVPVMAGPGWLSPQPPNSQRSATIASRSFTDRRYPCHQSPIRGNEDSDHSRLRADLNLHR